MSVVADAHIGPMRDAVKLKRGDVGIAPYGVTYFFATITPPVFQMALPGTTPRTQEVG